MLCRELTRFVEAIEDSAMTVFICSFSASRLKPRRLPFDLSFFLSLSLLENAKKPSFDGARTVFCAAPDGPAWARCCSRCCAALVASSSSSSPNGFSSVSLITFERSCVTPTLRLGSSYTVDTALVAISRNLAAHKKKKKKKNFMMHMHVMHLPCVAVKSSQVQ